jgi:hypothetical protein
MQRSSQYGDLPTTETTDLPTTDAADEEQKASAKREEEPMQEQAESILCLEKEQTVFSSSHFNQQRVNDSRDS